MNFEQNNSLKNESLELDEAGAPSSSREVLNDDFNVLREEISNLKDKDNKKVNEELAETRAAIKFSNSAEILEEINIFELKIGENETEFDFLGRLSKLLIDKQEDQDDKNNPETNKRIVKLLKKKNYQTAEVYESEDNKEIIKKAFIETAKSINKKELLNNESNISCLNSINISSNSRNMNWDLNENSEHEDRVDFFSETN